MSYTENVHDYEIQVRKKYIYICRTYKLYVTSSRRTLALNVRPEPVPTLHGHIRHVVFELHRI
jgi:hypothetical protein